MEKYEINKKTVNMFKLPIPTRLTDYLGEAVVWTVIWYWHKTEKNTND